MATKKQWSRRDALRISVATGCAAALPHAIGEVASASRRCRDPIIELGTRRELMIDYFLIDSLDGMSLQMHRPQVAAPTAAPADPLEYGTVIKDGDIYRLYTRDHRGAPYDGHEDEVTRYCESRDGIHWTKPELGLFELDGSTANNVVWHEPWVCHNFSPFVDSRPDVEPDARFKALGGVHRGGGLVAFASGDGIRWRRLAPDPVITSEPFAFDSQNVSFWSEFEQRYVCYFRSWSTPHGKLRSISRVTSDDFLHWDQPISLAPNFEGEHLYTSQTHPYFRAPQIYIALPTRFQPLRGNSTDVMLMTARGAEPYERTFREPLIRPGLDPERWENRANYVALNIVPTSDTEMSVYATPYRRLTWRMDGLTSLHAGADPGTMLTKVFRYTGSQLRLNAATSAGGSLHVEIQAADGQPIPGWTLFDCDAIVGDLIEHTVSWQNRTELTALAGQPIRLKFRGHEADLFSLKFDS